MQDSFDGLEARTPEERGQALAADLPRLISAAQALAGYSSHLGGIEPADVTDVAALSRLAVLRKSDLMARQAEAPPLGGLTTLGVAGFDQIFQSPGPIYEPARATHDWWRLGRFLHAAGIGPDDVVQNCFGYHLTPAGHIFENGAAAVGATVIPAGTGQTELQVKAAAALGASAYAGTPDYLKGMIVDEGVIVEIVTPGTGDPVPEGEVGEVLVTSFNPDYPLIRFATGDLSAVLPGVSPCGRTNMRIKGWMGRADQTTKIKGMFVRPEQVAEFVARHESVSRARVIATREGEADRMTLKVEGEGLSAADLDASARAVFKLGASIEVVADGTLPRDGVVIEDQRKYD
jgi:phenylacetate-CoA ligase